MAEATARAVAAGAHSVHVHVFDDGVETLAPGPTASVISAVRAASPGTPISLTTREGLECDPARRLEVVSRWTELPDLVTANQGEAGILELSWHLIERGVGIEAGLLSLDDAVVFVASGLAEHCVRALIEPLDADPAAAVEHAAAMERVLADGGVTIEQVHHGDGVASWAVNERALKRGHGIRTGIEDTTFMPDGRVAADNAELVREAAALIARTAAE